MTIYEAEDLYQQWDPEWMKFNRKVDKIKRLRAEAAHDKKKKEEEGIPTSFELACWFNK